MHVMCFAKISAHLWPVNCTMKLILFKLKFRVSFKEISPEDMHMCRTATDGQIIMCFDQNCLSATSGMY